MSEANLSNIYRKIIMGVEFEESLVKEEILLLREQFLEDQSVHMIESASSIFSEKRRCQERLD
jgi:hypothetical protein